MSRNSRPIHTPSRTIPAGDAAAIRNAFPALAAAAESGDPRAAARVLAIADALDRKIPADVLRQLPTNLPRAVVACVASTIAGAEPEGGQKRRKRTPRPIAERVTAAWLRAVRERLFGSSRPLTTPEAAALFRDVPRIPPSMRRERPAIWFARFPRLTAADDAPQGLDGVIEAREGVAREVREHAMRLVQEGWPFEDALRAIVLGERPRALWARESRTGGLSLEVRPGVPSAEVERFYASVLRRRRRNARGPSGERNALARLLVDALRMRDNLDVDGPFWERARREWNRLAPEEPFGDVQEIADAAREPGRRERVASTEQDVRDALRAGFRR